MERGVEVGQVDRGDGARRVAVLEPEQDRLHPTALQERPERHERGLVARDEHAGHAADDGARGRSGQPLRDPGRVGPAGPRAVERAAREGRRHPMATMRSIGTRARAATSSGTFTTPLRSRRQSRSLGSVIIFM